MISEDCVNKIIKSINVISGAANRIDENCEEKEETDEYRMYDDIQEINYSITEIMNILSGGKNEKIIQ